MNLKDPQKLDWQTDTSLLVALHRKKPTMYFVNSMTDLFHDDVPFEAIDKIMAVIALSPQHTFQVLTKRPERMKEYFDRANCEFKCENSLEYYQRQKNITTEIYDMLFVKRIAHQEKVGKFLLDKMPLLIINNFEIEKKGHSLNIIIERVIKGEKDKLFLGHNVSFRPFENGKYRYNKIFPLPNLWLGVSVENQEQADKRIPYLLETPAKVRFLSCEPLLAEINFRRCTYQNGDFEVYENFLNGISEMFFGINEQPSIDKITPPIDWVIVGGESGHNARPMHPDWVRSIRNQCQDANVPFFFKQWGSWLPDCQKETLEQLATSQPNHTINNYDYVYLGKHKLGCLLDGVEYKEMPKPNTQNTLPN